jgi:hypothetical protein
VSRIGACFVTKWIGYKVVLLRRRRKGARGEGGEGMEWKKR